MSSWLEGGRCDWAEDTERCRKSPGDAIDKRCEVSDADRCVKAKTPNNKTTSKKSKKPKTPTPKLIIVKKSIDVSEVIKHLTTLFDTTKMDEPTSKAVHTFMKRLTKQLNRKTETGEIRIMKKNVPFIIGLLLSMKELHSVIQKELLQMTPSRQRVFMDMYYYVHSDKFIQKIAYKSHDINTIKKDDYTSMIRSMYAEILKAKKRIDVVSSIYSHIIKFVQSMTINEQNSALTPTNVLYAKAIENEVTGYHTMKDTIIASELKSMIKSLEYVAPTSASQTIIFKVKFDKNKFHDTLYANDPVLDKTYYMKTFPVFGQFKQLTDTLQGEGFVYRELKKLVKYNITPNILTTVLNTEIDNLDIIYEEANQNIEILDRKKRIHWVMGIPITTKYPKWSKGNVIITQPGDITLHDMLELPTTTPEQVKSVIFQLLYLLYVFNKFNISHGDCHFNNIFVMRKPEKITLTYKINGKHYQLVTDRLLKIYDFDHTLIAKDTVIPINNKIQPVIRHINMRGPLCEDWAECPTFNDKLDLGIIYVRLAILADTVHRQTVKDIVKELLPVVDPTKTIGSTLVRDTLESLSSKEKKRLKDLGFKSRDEMVLGTDVVILNNTWLEYIRLINSDTLRRIVRSLDSIPNNQLYIPDSVMTPIETFWKKTSQFNSYLLSDDKIPSVQTSIIYTVDGV